MQTFVRNAPLDLTPQPEPAITDRSGPALSQGFLLTLISMVASDLCSDETMDALSQIDAEGWYLGQSIESLLDEMERKSPGSAFRIGRSVYFMLPTQLKSMGVVDAQSFMRNMSALWLAVTRGDSGSFRTSDITDHAARIEMEQPYSCDFEEGAFVGLLEGLGHRDVKTQHTTCLRKGHSFCTLLVSWK